MEKKARFNWKDAVELIVVLRNGRRIKLGEKEVKEIMSVLTLAAVHRF